MAQTKDIWIRGHVLNLYVYLPIREEKNKIYYTSLLGVFKAKWKLLRADFSRVFGPLYCCYATCCRFPFPYHRRYIFTSFKGSCSHIKSSTKIMSKKTGTKYLENCFEIIEKGIHGWLKNIFF